MAKPIEVLSDPDWWQGDSQEREATFAALRAERPVARSVLPGAPEIGLPDTMYWSVTRHAEVREVTRNHELFGSGQGTNIPDLPIFEQLFGSMINVDGPRHARLRRIVASRFTPKYLARLRANVEETAKELIDGIAERGSCDFVSEVAAPLPLRVITNMMGIPRSEEQFVLDRTSVLAGFEDPKVVPDIHSPGVIAGALLNAAQDLAAMMQELAEDRRRSPGNDLVTLLTTSQIDGEYLSTDELAAFFIVLVVAGNQTTQHSISHGLWLLSRHPDQRARWIAQFDALAPAAVEEIVRLATPILHFRRTVTQDGVSLGDYEFSAGDKVVLWYWSANRDETVFDDPHRLDLSRSPNMHLSFGGPGPHYCLGAHLARRELTAVFKELLRRLPDVDVVEEPVWLRSNWIHGIKRMKIAFSPTRP